MNTPLTDEQRKKLISTAIEARRNAYAPYSQYAVGAALLSKSGKIFTGCNVENAVNSDGTCAERVAVFKAVSEGERDFSAIAVVTINGGMPCGSCRQVLAEFGLDIQVIIAEADGKICQECTLSELLPGAFGPRDLGKS